MQFRDGAGRVGEESDTIDLQGGGAGDSAYSNAVLEDSPEAYWRLAEIGGTSAVNSAGPGHTGTYNGGPELGRDPLVRTDTNNRAVRFRAISEQSVTVPHSTSLNPGSEVTVEAWVKPDSIPASGFATVAAKPGAYALQFNNGQIEFKIDTEGGSGRATAVAGVVQAGTAYHVVGTYDGTDIRLYVNGQVRASATLPEGVRGDVADSPSGVSLAAWRGETEFLTGTLDEVAVYPVVLSEGRINAHLAAATPPPPPPPVATPSALSATATSDAVELKWNDNSNNESEFVIERSTNPYFVGAEVLATEANEESYLDKEVAAGTTYYYRVQGYNATTDVRSGWSNVVRVTTKAVAATPPSTPPPVGPAAAKPPTVLPATLSFAGTKRTIRVDRRGRLSYSFTAAGGVTGALKFATKYRVWVSSKRKRKATILAKSFKVPGSGKVKLKLKLSKKSLGILKRNRKLTLKVGITVWNQGGPAYVSKKLTLKAPTR